MISVLGSTGSIGVSALKVARRLGLEVAALTARQNIALIEQQARAYKPRFVAMSDETAARDLKTRLSDTDISVGGGDTAVCEAAAMGEICLSAIVGSAAILPTYAAVSAGVRRLALANKESLVCAGDIILSEAKRRGVEVIPVDSEHSAIFQCLDGRPGMKKLWLTASGGPFWGYSTACLENVTIADALCHPNWAMGKKITIDSATLMNKGLEFIEAMRLFDVSPSQIEVLIHRESIIHSMVEFCDGAIIAQLGLPDMTIPIQYALTYPRRFDSGTSPPDLAALGNLSFSRPDTDTFKCLAIAIDAAARGGACCTAMNAANEVAVEAFLESHLSLLGIAEVVGAVYRRFEGGASIDDVLQIDTEARLRAREFIG